jgi:hypothetical protein
MCLSISALNSVTPGLQFVANRHPQLLPLALRHQEIFSTIMSIVDGFHLHSYGPCGFVQKLMCMLGCQG